jgi:hypothetical protein
MSGHASNNVVLSVLSSPTLGERRPQDLSGAHRQMLDDLTFLLQGLTPTASTSVRIATAGKLLSTVLDVQPPAELDAAPQRGSSTTSNSARRAGGDHSRDMLMVMRSSNAFAALADLMPDASAILQPDNEVRA